MLFILVRRKTAPQGLKATRMTALGAGYKSPAYPMLGTGLKTEISLGLSGTN